MGIAKTIELYGVSSIYHPEPEMFLQRLSLALQVNLDVLFFDTSENKKKDVKQIVDNGFSKVLKIYMEMDRKFDDFYGIELPIEHEEREFSVTFYPNNIIGMFHIPFAQSWKWFVEDMLDKKVEYLGGRENYVKQTMGIRELYLPIFKKLGCDKVFISTDAHHRWEADIVFDGSVDKKVTFDELVYYANEKDGIKVFNLIHVLQGKYYSVLKKLYAENEYLKIAFFDEV